MSQWRLLYFVKIKLKLPFGPFRADTLKVTVVFDLHFGYGATFMMGSDIMKTLKLYNIVNHNCHANNPGRPKKLTERDERNIIRAVHHLRSDLELRLVFSPQLLCGLYAEYLIDMDIGIYNHAGKAC